MLQQSDLINLEILKIARELVINEHTDRRANLHNQWLVDSDRLWRTNRKRLAYPEIPPYPTEKEILERAKVLMGFLESQNNDEKKIKDHGNLFATKDKKIIDIQNGSTKS